MQGQDESRVRRKNGKEEIVRARGFKNIRLEGKVVAEFHYQPTGCSMPCQLVKTGRRIIFRLLSWKRWLRVFLRAATHMAGFRCPP